MLRATLTTGRPTVPLSGTRLRHRTWKTISSSVRWGSPLCWV